MWAGFAVVLAAMILNILDSTIVNVAAPAIQADLAMAPRRWSGSPRRTPWRWPSGLMAGARLGDMFGRKRMLLLGLVGFVRRLGALLVRVVGRRARRSRARCRDSRRR